MLIFSCPCDFLFFEKATKKWKKVMSYKAKSGEAFIIKESIQVIQVKLKVIQLLMKPCRQANEITFFG